VNTRQSQSGITLVVSLIMLVVLTLLVVSATRFGIINLKISGNAQTEAEAAAATQVAIEKTMEMVVAAEKIDTVPAQPAVVVSTGGTTYTVNVRKPACVLTKNVLLTTLDHTNAQDVPCISNTPQPTQFDSNGLPIPKPTACKDQQWDIAASVSDPSSGANVSMLQGVSLRVPAQVQCP
jgi:Tfp pilus assembly protein PilX